MKKSEDLKARIEKHCERAGVALKADYALQIAKGTLAAFREFLEKYEKQAKRSIQMLDECESELPDSIADFADDYGE